MNTQSALVVIDVVAVIILVCGIYFPRHYRKDLVVAFSTVNIGVLAVCIVLLHANAGLGLGLGLFGVLSIIRLRSDELAQEEVAYYFAALAVGLISGMSTTINATSIALIVLILASVAVFDSPQLFRGYRHQLITLDGVYQDESELDQSGCSRNRN